MKVNYKLSNGAELFLEAEISPEAFLSLFDRLLAKVEKSQPTSSKIDWLIFAGLQCSDCLKKNVSVYSYGSTKVCFECLTKRVQQDRVRQEQLQTSKEEKL